MSELKQSIAQLLIDNFRGTTAKRASDMAIAIVAFVNADRQREIEAAFCGRPGTGECSCRKFADDPTKCENRRTQPEATKPAQDLGAAIGDTGNAEADRLINRLMSSDPDFDDCADAAAFIRRMVIENKGPDGFATWKDAAVAERMKRTSGDNCCSHGIHYDNACGACIPPRGTTIYASPADALIAGDREPMTLVKKDGQPYAAYPRRKQAEVYASGLSSSASVEIIDGVFVAAIQAQKDGHNSNLENQMKENHGT